MLCGFASYIDRHVIDLAVTTRATDPAIHVRGVIVKDIIRQPMNLHPFHRCPGISNSPAPARVSDYLSAPV